jgi:hypothetical protein
MFRSKGNELKNESHLYYIFINVSTYLQINYSPSVELLQLEINFTN